MRKSEVGAGMLQMGGHQELVEEEPIHGSASYSVTYINRQFRSHRHVSFCFTSQVVNKKKCFPD